MEACNSASVMGGRAGSSPMVHKAHTFLMCLLVRDVKVGKILRHGGQKAGRVSNYILIMTGVILPTKSKFSYYILLSW